jgi:GNAT superfamily N-acetyltransferase
MIHADAALARRLEGLICREWHTLAGIAGSLWPDRGVTSLEVGGGVALYIGEGGLVNVATGLAMQGPVEDADLRTVEDFYAMHGVPAMLGTCPFADPTLFAVLGARGWQVTEFENVLAMERADIADGSAAPPPGVEVRVCETPAERESFGRLAARGFSDHEEPQPVQVEFGQIVAAHAAHTLVMGYVDGRPAGTGSVDIEGDVAWLSADSTLPEFRSRGVQQAVQRRRLELARDAGCSLVVTEASPGSGSQRNMERLGFRVVYPHLYFAKV